MTLYIPNSIIINDPYHVSVNSPATLSLAYLLWICVYMALISYVIGDHFSEIFSDLIRSASKSQLAFLGVIGLMLWAVFDTLKSVFWGFLGREILEMSNQQLMLKHQLFGFTRTRCIPLTELKAFSFNTKPSKYHKGKILIHHHSKTWSFGESLKNQESIALLNFLEQNLSKQLSLQERPTT